MSSVGDSLMWLQVPVLLYPAPTTFLCAICHTAASFHHNFFIASTKITTPPKWDNYRLIGKALTC
jgi:hypothetical protein